MDDSTNSREARVPQPATAIASHRVLPEKVGEYRIAQKAITDAARRFPGFAGTVRALAASGARLITLTNGSTEVAERLFAAAGIRDHFERLLSIEDAGAWKPAAAAYEYAAHTCSVDPADMLLVAVHPWDIDGAKRAGLRTAWVNRDGRPYPGHFLAPDHSVAVLSELAEVVS